MFTSDSVFSIPFSLFCRCYTTNPHRVSRRRKKLFRKFTTSSTNKIYTVKAKILTYKLHHFLLAAAGFLCNFLFEFASVCLVVSLLFCYFCKKLLCSRRISAKHGGTSVYNCVVTSSLCNFHSFIVSTISKGITLDVVFVQQ